VHNVVVDNLLDCLMQTGEGSVHNVVHDITSGLK
jgi:hypothetical protein